jgi:sorbitol/mannitol transport system permease protein
MARAVTTNARRSTPRLPGHRVPDFLPDPLDDPHLVQDRGQAINDPPLFLFFDWTLKTMPWSGTFGLHALLVELGHHRGRLDAFWGHHRGSRGLVDGLRALARTKDILLWMLSTKMLPAVGVLYPIYLIFIQLGLLDTRIGLVIVLMLINLPIIVWMLYTYFREIPGEILEAARMDGATLREEILYVLTPMAVPGIASTVLLNFILAWNEAFWTLNLTAARRRR